MKRTIAALSIAALLAAFGAAPARSETVNRIILRVNDRVLTLYDYLERRTELSREILASDLSGDEKERLLAQVGRNLMTTLFQEMLLLSRADQLEIFVDQNLVDEEMARMREDLGAPSQEEFVAALARTGISIEDFREQVEQRLKIRDVLGREVHSAIDLDDDVLLRVYREHMEEFRTPEQVRAREIVVLDTGTPEAARRRDLARRIRERLEGGATLEDIAGEYSEAGLTSGVIDLGMVNLRDLDGTLQGALEGVEAGAYSAPVEARGGTHIVQVMEREEAAVRPFEEVKDLIRNYEYDRRYQEGVLDLLAKLEERAYILEDVPAEAAGFRQAALRESTGDLDLPPPPQPEAAAGGEGEALAGVDVPEPPLEMPPPEEAPPGPVEETADVPLPDEPEPVLPGEATDAPEVPEFPEPPPGS